jgi:hypothetical protein
MKLFRVTKRTLCFGTGDPSPEWVRDVWAENRGEVLTALEQYPHVQLISVREVDGYNIDQFHGFLRAIPRKDTSREVTDDEVREMLGGL